MTVGRVTRVALGRSRGLRTSLSGMSRSRGAPMVPCRGLERRPIAPDYRCDFSLSRRGKLTISGGRITSRPTNCNRVCNRVLARNGADRSSSLLLLLQNYNIYIYILLGGGTLSFQNTSPPIKVLTSGKRNQQTPPLFVAITGKNHYNSTPP